MILVWRGQRTLSLGYSAVTAGNHSCARSILSPNTLMMPCSKLCKVLLTVRGNCTTNRDVQVPSLLGSTHNPKRTVHVTFVEQGSTRNSAFMLLYISSSSKLAIWKIRCDWQFSLGFPPATAYCTGEMKTMVSASRSKGEKKELCSILHDVRADRSLGVLLLFSPRF